MNQLINNRISSFGYAFKGIFFLIKNETNAKIHLFISIFVIVAGFILKISIIEWCFIILSIGFVFVVEGLNTAIEKIIDFISPQYNKLAGIIKDVAAGSVLIASLTSATIGIIIFLPKILNLFT